MLYKKLEGLIAAPFTPMHPDGSLNIGLIGRYYQFLKYNKVKGAFICGSTGEGVSLTLAEKKAVAAAWAHCTKDDPDFQLMLLLGGTSLNEAQELAGYAVSVGVDAVSFMSPFYFKPSSVKILAAVCREVAAAVPDTPFYYYHIPVLTGVHYPMYELLKEVETVIPNFAGIKYTHEDFMDFSSCLHFAGGRYDLLWGRDENMLPALSLGARGSVGSTFNYAAPLYHRLMEAFDKGDLKGAAELQQLSIAMIRLLGKYGGIGTGKAYMRLVGLDCGTFRLPVTHMTSSTFEEFKNEAESVGFRTFQSLLPT